MVEKANIYQEILTSVRTPPLAGEPNRVLNKK